MELHESKYEKYYEEEHGTLINIQFNAVGLSKKIQYTASNYTVARDTLCERFINPKKLLNFLVFLWTDSEMCLWKVATVSR